MFENVKALSIPQGEVIKIESGNVVLWEKPSSFKNWVLYSIDTDGNIYNGGLGYKKDYRIRSSGGETFANGQACTGFIPCKGGDVLRFGFIDETIWMECSAYNTFINFSDSTKTNIGQMTSQPANYGIFEKMPNEYKNIKKVNGFWEYTVVEGYNIGFVRFTIPYDGGRYDDPTKCIVTVNEEIVL